MVDMAPPTNIDASAGAVPNAAPPAPQQPTALPQVPNAAIAPLYQQQPQQAPDQGMVSGGALPTSLTPNPADQAPVMPAQPAQPAQPQELPPEHQPRIPIKPVKAPIGGQGQPPSAVPTTVVQSEPTPQITKPTIDPRPLHYFETHDPQYYQDILYAAQATGVDPQRLAAHKWAESGAQVGGVADGSSGELGGMQIMPGTWTQYDPQHQLNPKDPAQALLLAGHIIHHLDARYGRNTPASIAGYNGSPNNPKAQMYASRILMNAKFKPEDFATASDSHMTPQGIVQSAVQGGPVGALQYMAQTAPAGMPLSDVWNHAEGMLVQAFLERGDIAGAQHARDFILQLSHTGSNMYLMQADQQLRGGDARGAAVSLARAHAFFPDGTIGRFSVDGAGNLWGERIDEHNPKRVLGAPFKVTPEGIAGLLNQTMNPQQYLTTLQGQIKTAAYVRRLDAMGQYYAQRPQVLEDIARIHQQTTLASTAAREQGAASRAAKAQADADRRAAQANQTRLQAAGISAGKGAATQAAREADQYFGETPVDAEVGKWTTEERGTAAQLYTALRTQGGVSSGPQALAVVRGLHDGSLSLLPMRDGRYAIVHPDGKPTGAYLPGDVAQLMLPAQPQGQGRGALNMGLRGRNSGSPIGAGASTPFAYAAGVRSDLSGTRMPGQPQPPQVYTPPQLPDQSSAVPNPGSQ